MPTNMAREPYTTPVPLTFAELETIILAIQIAGQTDKVTEDALVEKLRQYQQKAWDAK